MLRGGMDDIVGHGWFSGLVWATLESKLYRAPHIPTISSDKDVSNFEEYDEDNSTQPFKCPAVDPFVDF